MNYDDLVRRLGQVYECGNGECGLKWSLKLPREAAAAIQELQRDAMRYRWLCDGHGYILEERGICGPPGLKEKHLADELIDEAMQRET